MYHYCLKLSCLWNHPAQLKLHGVASAPIEVQIPSYVKRVLVDAFDKCELWTVYNGTEGRVVHDFTNWDNLSKSAKLFFVCLGLTTVVSSYLGEFYVGNFSIIETPAQASFQRWHRDVFGVSKRKFINMFFLLHDWDSFVSTQFKIPSVGVVDAPIVVFDPCIVHRGVRNTSNMPRYLCSILYVSKSCSPNDVEQLQRQSSYVSEMKL